MKKRIWLILLTAALVLGLTLPTALAAPYWDAPVDYSEGSRTYTNYTYYSEIAQILRDIETTSNRVQIEVIGQSAAGHDLFLAIVSDPSSGGRLGRYQAFRNTMLKDPQKAQEMMEQGNADFKVPIFINASIHGNEPTGTDAALRMLKTLAYEDTEEVQNILENTIVLINISQNPDGRIVKTRANSVGTDVNRDFITQSQPESKITVEQIVRWNPMIFLDLHGHVNPMLIEPCTPPHNPNYEYDLFIKWAFDQAVAMGEAVKANTSYNYQIPYRDRAAGWDDYPPIFTPMYAMYHGAYGHTLETPRASNEGLDAHYYAIMAAATFAADNKMEMFHDQIEIYKRGITSYFQDEKGFPEAYIIPVDKDNQMDPIQAARVVDFLLFNDIEVKEARRPFTADGAEYPAGTYVVMMNQPKRGLANTILWEGEDISDDISSMYDISGWNIPETWGINRVAVTSGFNAQLTDVNKAGYPKGTIPSQAQYYVIPNYTNNAIKAVNRLLDLDLPVGMVSGELEGFGAGAFLVPAKGNNQVMGELAREYNLEIGGVSEADVEVKELRKPKIAVHTPWDAEFVLENMGFDVEYLSETAVRNNIQDYDVLVNYYNRTNAATRNAVRGFVSGGGGYVGLGANSIAMAANTGLLDVSYNSGGSNDNGVIRVTNDPGALVTANYPAEGFGFVYRPGWITRVGEGVSVAATIIDSPDFFMAGHWRNRKDAQGSPVIAYGDYGEGKAVVFGTEPVFRAHPEGYFRSVANAIFYTLD
jgi:hypothetical protein